MPALVLPVLFGFSFTFFSCEGGIIPPANGPTYIFLPGVTAKIKWTFDDAISTVNFRAWSFMNASGQSESLAEIYRNHNPIITTTLYDVDVEKPATLVLKNIDQSYDGIYTFSLNTASSLPVTHSVIVFVANKPNIELNCSSPVTLIEGDSFTCLCNGEGGNPPANVIWYKDGIQFGDVGKKSKNKQALNLLNVGVMNNGIYKCVSRSFPYYTEKSIQVTIYFKPVNTNIKFSTISAVPEDDDV